MSFPSLVVRAFRRAVICASLTFAVVGMAQVKQPFANSISCTIVPIGPPVAVGLNAVSARGLSDADANGNCALVGQCSTFPIFQRGSLPVGTTWTVALPPTTIVDGDLKPAPQILGHFIPLFAGWYFDRPGFTAGLALPTSALPNSVYAMGTGAALNGLGGARTTVRVGYTVRHFPGGLRYQACAWVLNNAGNSYIEADLNPTDAGLGKTYDTTRAYGVVQLSGGTLVAYGEGATLGASGFSSQSPLFWTVPLNGDGTLAVNGDGTEGTLTTLEALATKRDAVAYDGSTRADVNTFAGSGSGTLPVAGGASVSSTWAVYWGGPATEVVNLNDPTKSTGLPAIAQRAGQNVGGVAYAIAAFPNGKPTPDDIVGGAIQRWVTVGRRSELRTRACVWLSDQGGGSPFSTILMPDAGAQLAAGVTINNSLARGVFCSISGGATKGLFAVGSCSFSQNNAFQGWRGYMVNVINQKYYSLTPYADQGVSDAGPQPWVVTGVKAINPSGWMLGTAKKGYSGDQDVLLILNDDSTWSNSTLTPANN